MQSVSPAIVPAQIFTAGTGHFDRLRLSFASATNSNPKRVRRKSEAKNNVPAAASIDYNDPDWKKKYQEDFEARFRIPHIADALDDAVSYPSTFCLRMRTPVSSGFVETYPADDVWHGYINPNDRVLLKVLSVLIQVVHGWSNGICLCMKRITLGSAMKPTFNS